MGLRTPQKQAISIQSDASGYEVDVWAFDIATNEQHGQAAIASDHPVEDGSTISDHLQLQPIELTASGCVTNSPFEDDSQDDRDFDAWERLRLLLEAREPLIVTTRRRVYRDMVITSISDASVPGQGQLIEPTITFKQIKVVSQQTTRVQAARLKPRVRNNAPGTRDVGNQNPDDAAQKEAAAEARTRSWALQIVGGG